MASSNRPGLHRHLDGHAYRDLNGNGHLDPFEDSRLSAEARAEDLLKQMSMEEKIGLMFQTVVESGHGGELLESPGAISKSPTSVVVREKLMNHFNVHRLGTPRDAARWSNALQRLAEQTPHGIPVTISTDPRHSFTENSGVSFTAGSFSQWPEPMGLAAVDDLALISEFARVAAAEYRAVGIRSALHPQVDLATEPRWGRQVQTFGHDASRVAEYTTAYIEGFQGPALGPDSVACVTKHFPGAGPQLDGEDAHFPYGREQVYPGGMFDYHLLPFRAAVAAGTAGIMPYYGMPVGLVLGGEPVEEVGFGYNRQILTGLLRGAMHYDGVIVTDWELVNDNVVGDKVLPARAWGVENLSPTQRMLKILDAGADQFGGEECVDLLVGLVRDGVVAESRIDVSARRLLLVKFRLGLFDNPFVDEDVAEEVVGSSEFRALGKVAQARSTVVLKNGRNEREAIPFARGRRVYSENVRPEALQPYAIPAQSPDDADLAIVRLGAPFEPRDDLFLESFFQQGSLEFPPGLVYRLQQLGLRAPLVLVVDLRRPAILTPFVQGAAVICATFGTSDEALAAALFGVVPPEGTLPISLPRSMQAVRASRPDVPSDWIDPLYPIRAGVTGDT